MPCGASMHYGISTRCPQALSHTQMGQQGIGASTQQEIGIEYTVHRLRMICTQVAQQEIERVRAEMAAEAASLRSVVQEQSAQVAALKQHAERMEQQAESAQAQVHVFCVPCVVVCVPCARRVFCVLTDTGRGCMCGASVRVRALGVG